MRLSAPLSFAVKVGNVQRRNRVALATTALGMCLQKALCDFGIVVSKSVHRNTPWNYIISSSTPHDLSVGRSRLPRDTTRWAFQPHCRSYMLKYSATEATTDVLTQLIRGREKERDCIYASKCPTDPGMIQIGKTRGAVSQGWKIASPRSSTDIYLIRGFERKSS